MNDSLTNEFRSNYRVSPLILLVAPLLVALCGAFSRRALAQTPYDSTPMQMPTAQITTLKTTVRRVGVDVVVTDPEDRPVSGLKEEDFSVTEDNAPQPVLSFSFHTDLTHELSAGLKFPSLPSNTFFNADVAPEAGTSLVVFFDAFGMSIHDAEFAKGELLKYLRERQMRSSNPPIAIFVLSKNSLSLMQGFTDQRSVQELETKIQNAIVERPQRSWSEYAPPQYEALKQVAHFLAPIPDRKIVIWFGATFPHSFILYSGHIVVRTLDLSDQTRQLLDLLNLSHVSIYPVDVLGVRVNPRISAATYDTVGVSPNSYRRFAEWNGERVDAANAIADATGGHAFYGTNDLQGAVEQALNDGSTYYSLTYEPTNPKYDGSLRHIKVTLKKSGYNLSYRKTYYADDLNALAHAGAPESPLTPALERGLPLAHGLFVEAHLDTAGAPIPATPEQMKVLSQFEAMRDRADAKAPNPPVMMQQYTVSYALFAKQLELPANEAGVRMASLEFGAMAYDEDGRKLTGLDTRVDDPLPPDRYAKIAADGYRVAQTIAIPTTATCLRLAVRDVKGNRVGSLEIKLPLAQAAPAEANAQAK